MHNFGIILTRKEPILTRCLEPGLKHVMLIIYLAFLVELVILLYTRPQLNY